VAHNVGMLAVLAAVSVLVGAPVKITVTAPDHVPPVGARWNYSVAATVGGRPIKGLITEQIVDPIGGTHPVLFGSGKKVIKNWPFKGVFRDYMIWPKSSRGVPLTWRITVVVGKTKRVINYKVTPQG
jgi:hypothetical protein